MTEGRRLTLGSLSALDSWRRRTLPPPQCRETTMHVQLELCGYRAMRISVLEGEEPSAAGVRLSCEVLPQKKCALRVQPANAGIHAPKTFNHDRWTRCAGCRHRWRVGLTLSVNSAAPTTVKLASTTPRGVGYLSRTRSAPILSKMYDYMMSAAKEPWSISV